MPWGKRTASRHAAPRRRAASHRAPRVPVHRGRHPAAPPVTPHRAASHRAGRSRRHRALRAVAGLAAFATAALAAMAVGAFLGMGPLQTREADPDPLASAGAAQVTRPSATATMTASPTASPSTELPDAAGALPLGKRALTTIPARTTQVVLVRGPRTGSSTATVELFQRQGASWGLAASWQGDIGKSGWTTHHVEGDLKTPVGTFTLSDAGGRKPDPGSALPYYQSTAFIPPASQPGFGDSTADAFDYVIAVDYNRVNGRSPLDTARPLGAARGGGIWLHVDHGGPTHGCVSIPVSGMRYLLRHLTPQAHPVVVMGNAAWLGR